MECEQTGRSLRQWLLALPLTERMSDFQRELLRELDPLAWSLLENLVMAAIKVVPLGQTAGQAMLRRLALQLPAWMAEAATIAPTATRNFSPMQRRSH